MARLENVILKEGDAIKCEAEHGEDGHSGLIIFQREGGMREVLGRTDPVYDTAEDAVAAMEKTVDGIRGSQPSEEMKSSGTKKTRKRKGEKDGVSDNREDE